MEAPIYYYFTMGWPLILHCFTPRDNDFTWFISIPIEFLLYNLKVYLHHGTPRTNMFYYLVNVCDVWCTLFHIFLFIKYHNFNTKCFYRQNYTDIPLFKKSKEWIIVRVYLFKAMLYPVIQCGSCVFEIVYLAQIQDSYIK